ncbi:MAG TPA: hypothetical protein VME45_06400 [Stellaceae bacterium]|nr:hypothetical protein [Stellaceae bacterium]
MRIEEYISAIEEISLPAGALRLFRRRQADVSSGLAPRAETREAARIITMAWGDRYIADLLSLTIPALLAPGNIPAFVRHFDSELIIVTEARLFDLIARAPVIHQMLRYCDVRLVPVDDLLSNWYGITLTYALVRGFIDLGPDMVGAHLVFLNADFIVADGSYAKLAEMILRGERLVVSPSYCMVQEDTVDQLRARYDPAEHTLAVPHREMAAMIIAHRHNTIRAKTVNQQLFRIHRYDQFYWFVDDRTLVGRQLPIAVIYMRPERMLTEMPTFWDYGVISEYCPTATPCVLGDSDDFLMAELRTEGTFADLLHLGWPDVEEIAADLSSFTTKDHHDYGRHTLVLHSGDLPASLEDGKAALGEFVDQVYARLSPPISYRNHPFWAPVFPQFLANQAARYERREMREQALAELLRQDPEAAARHREIARLNSRIREASATRDEIQAQAASHRRRAELQFAELDLEYRKRRHAVEDAAAAQGDAIEREARGVMDELAALELRRAELTAELERAVNDRCADAAGKPREGNATRAEPSAGISVAGRSIQVAGRSIQTERISRSGRLAAWYYRVFGQMPRTTVLHPYHAMLRPARTAIIAAGEVSDILLISSRGTLSSILVRDLEARKLTITPRMASAHQYREMIGEERKFGLCVCDLSMDDLLKLRSLLDNVRPLLTERARIVVFHQNSAELSLDACTFKFARVAFPLFGCSRISFSGSWFGVHAARLFERTLNKAPTPWRLITLGLTLALCAPLAYLATRSDARRPPQRLPSRCASMTIEIELG